MSTVPFRDHVQGREELTLALLLPLIVSVFYSQTDPESTDYVVEHGAYRTFQAVKLAELEEERVQQEKEDEEANNPMLV